MISVGRLQKVKSVSVCLVQTFVIHHTMGTFYWVGLTDERTGHWEWVNQTPYVMNRRWDVLSSFLHSDSQRSAVETL